MALVWNWITAKLLWMHTVGGNAPSIFVLKMQRTGSRIEALLEQSKASYIWEVNSNNHD